jgi:hypothetical protein
VLEAVEALDESVGFETVDLLPRGSNCRADLGSRGLADGLPLLLGVDGGRFEFGEGFGGRAAVATAEPALDPSRRKPTRSSARCSARLSMSVPACRGFAGC